MNAKFDLEKDCSISLGLVDIDNKTYHVFVSDGIGNFLSIFMDEKNLDKLRFLLALKDDLIKDEDEVVMERGSEEVKYDHTRSSDGE